MPEPIRPHPTTPTFPILMDFPPEALSARLDDHRHPLPSADASGGDAVAAPAPAQLQQERQHQPGARRSKRVSQGDCSAVDIDLLAIELQLLLDREVLCRESL